jgi:hypothetical protein
MAQKITHWLLIALVLMLGFGQLLRFDFRGLPIYLHDILIAIILGSQIYKVRNLVIPIGLKLFSLGLGIGWVRALTLYPLELLTVPFLYTLRILAYLALYSVLHKSKLRISPDVFLVSGITTLAIGLVQYIVFPDMRIFQYLGWDDHLNRLTLPHFDPTFTAVMMGLFLLSCRPRVMYGLASVVAILLTYSRSVWLSLILTAGAFIRPKKYLLALVLVVLVSISLLPQRFGEGTNLLRTYSITSRFETDISYVQKYKWDLLIGRGMNTLLLDTDQSKYENHVTGPNNSYLYILATTGLLGLIGWGMFLKSIYQKSTHKPMIVFFCIASLFNNVLFYPFALLWVLLVEAMAPSEV